MDRGGPDSAGEHGHPPPSSDQLLGITEPATQNLATTAGPNNNHDDSGTNQEWIGLGSLDSFEFPFDPWPHVPGMGEHDMAALMTPSSSTVFPGISTSAGLAGAPGDPNSVEHNANQPWNTYLSPTAMNASSMVFPQSSPIPFVEEVGNASAMPLLPDELFARALRHRALPQSSHAMEVPTIDALRCSVQTYLQAFNVHLPLFHTPSFHAAAEIPQQLLAVAAIGALYRLERRTAAFCYLAARNIAKSETQRENQHSLDSQSIAELLEPHESMAAGMSDTLGSARTQLLLSFFGVFHGTAGLVESTLRESGSQTVVSLSLANLSSESVQRTD